jgi:putative hydrolase of the HAD superfamily
MKHAIFSDFGGVLTAPIQTTFEALQQRTGIPVGHLRFAMNAVAQPFGGDFMAPLDTPHMTQEEWGRRVGRVLLEEFGMAVDLAHFPELWFAARPTNHTLLFALYEMRKLGHRIGLLTNNVPAWRPYWRAMIPLDLFEVVIDSCEVGYRKPDPCIFHLASAEMGVSPASCVLIDDRPENCRAGRRCGWSVIEFTDNEQTVEALGRIAGDHDLLPPFLRGPS